MKELNYNVNNSYRKISNIYSDVTINGKLIS